MIVRRLGGRAIGWERNGKLRGFVACYSTASQGSTNWNQDESLFTFTRGRFLFDEKNQLALRTVKFDMNELARVAAASVGADKCVHVQKCPDGFHNKAYVLRMDNGREVVAKVPTPNAGLPHYVTASEVATMDYMRNMVSAPVPKVFAYNSRAESSPVGAEYIIMEKAPGIPLSQVWERLKYQQKLRVLTQIAQLNKTWLQNVLHGYGSLFYVNDLSADERPSGVPMPDDRFALGPFMGREWLDAGRQELLCDRGPFPTMDQYRAMVNLREAFAIKTLPEYKYHMSMLTGPHPLYQPSEEKKSWCANALADWAKYGIFQQDPQLQYMIYGRLWHNDLDLRHIFVESSNPTEITAIIDWQATQIAPLFDHQLSPQFLKQKDVLLLGENPIQKEDYSAWDETDCPITSAWEAIVRKTSLEHHLAIIVLMSTHGQIRQSARRLYERDEARFVSHVLELFRLAGHHNPADAPASDTIQFTAEKWEEAKLDEVAARLSVEAWNDLKAALGELWPDRGVVENHQYDEAKAALAAARDKFADRFYGDNAEGRKAFLESWPFDS
ncbi:phosphotransferase enzyme family protein [Paramyrothecium foliicola]|nr:phosphotransferase enzyme family protein [Paramyrothecium foliicola]